MRLLQCMLEIEQIYRQTSARGYDIVGLARLKKETRKKERGKNKKGEEEEEKRKKRRK